MSAAVLLTVGLVLCFWGARALRVGVLAAGFGAVWLITDAFDVETGVALVVSAAGGIAAFLCTLLTARLMLFVGGLCVGAVVGARLLVLLTSGSGDDDGWLLALVFVPSFALLCGFLTQRFQQRFLAWGTAFAGAGLLVAGIGRIGLGWTDELWRPDTAAGVSTCTVLWIALTLAGRRVQRVRSGPSRRWDRSDVFTRIG